MKVKNPKRQSKDPSRLRIYSFVATLLIIAIIVAGSYYQTLPTVEHIPDNFTFIPQEWMSYTPSFAQYVDYVNYQQAYSFSHNISLFGSESVFQLPQIGVSIYPSDINYEVDMQLQEPQYSGSATILQLESAKQASLTDALQTMNSTKTAHSTTYDGYTVYELLMQRFGDKEASLGFMCSVNQHFLLSNDQKSAAANVKAILDQISTKRLSLFDDTNVRRAVYATGVTDQSYVGLFVGMFPTQLNDTKMAVKTIVGNGESGSIEVSRALLFPTSDVALARLDQAHRVYKNAASYRILDSWLVIMYNYPESRLQAELTGI